MASVDQITSLLSFIEENKEMALGHCNRSKEGRSQMKRLWAECADILNSISSNCVTKTPDQWRLYFNEYKSKLLKKIKAEKAEYQATGGGPAKPVTLTPLQDRLYAILGRDVGDPLLGVRHNPLSSSQVWQAEVVEDVLEFACNESLVEVEVVEVEHPKCSQQQELPKQLPQQKLESPSAVPRRRREKRSRPADTNPETALEEATDKLLSMEKIISEAMSAHARSVDRHAKAMERHAAAMESLAQVIEKSVNAVLENCRPLPTKRNRSRIINESDSE